MHDPTSQLIASLFAERHIFTVSELTERIKALLEIEFFDLDVRGEISNFKRHHSGHWYFTLKDSEAQIRAVFFKQWNRLLRFEPENGLEVRARGRLGIYAVRGEYELFVEMMEPIGIGALQLAFEQRLRRLAAEGIFAEERKRPLPLLPRRIGIITSQVGSVIHDMLQIIERRNRAIPIVIAPVRVQGQGAAVEIADAIKLLSHYAKKRGHEIDVIILARGGGSSEDLWAFNEEAVARAICDSDIPIVSAIGHETDFTIADLVADMRAPTPSAAAEIVAPTADYLHSRIAELNDSLGRVMNHYLLRRRANLQYLIGNHVFADSTQFIRSLTDKLCELEIRARQAISRRSEDCRQRFSARTAALHALSPLAVLGRGYLLAQDESGQLLTRAATLRIGDRLNLHFIDGRVSCEVTENSELLSKLN